MAETLTQNRQVDQEPNVFFLWKPEVPIKQVEQEKLPFDPKRDITQEDWTEIKWYLEECKDENKWLAFFECIMATKIIDPSYDLGLGNIDLQKIGERMFKQMQKIKDYSGILRLAGALKILDLPYNIVFSDWDWQKICDDPDTFRRMEFWDDFSKSLMKIKIFDPSHELGLTGQDWQKMRNNLREDQKNNEYNNFISCAMAMKILDPSIDLQLTEKDWLEMKKVLEECREVYRSDEQFSDGSKFLFCAMAMKILTAKKVELTKDCLKITMEDDKPQIKTSLPLPKKLEF